MQQNPIVFTFSQPLIKTSVVLIYSQSAKLKDS